MITLVIGGSGSGKSAYAERLLEEVHDVKKKYYLATMRVYDEDGMKKAERHKALRSGKGFLTIEQPESIELAAEKIEKSSAVLLECISNLTANEMFGERVCGTDEVIEKVLNGVYILERKVKHLIIVTNNVFEDGISYDAFMMNYLKALSEINRELAKKAEAMAEVVVGIPITAKDNFSIRKI